MLALFRKDFIGNALLLIPYCAILRIKSLLYPQVITYQDEYGYFNRWWIELLEEKPLASSIILILTISIMAYFVNIISNWSMIYHRKSLFPAVIFVLLSSFLDSFLVLHPIHFGLFFLLIAFVNIVAVYKSASSAGQVFNTGFFLAVASLFYFPYILFFFFGFISLMIMKSFRFRDRLQYVIGFFVPYGLAMAVMYIKFGDMAQISNYITSNVAMIPLPFEISVARLMAFGVFALMIVYVILQYGSYLSKKTIQIRKNTEILYWIMLFSIPGVFFWKHLSLTHLLILVPSLSLLLAMNFSISKNKWSLEVVHLLGLGFLYYNHFLL